MALSNTVQLRDGMSNVLSRISSSLSTVNDRFERMQNLTERAAPTGLYAQFNSELTGVREELTRTVSEVEELRSSMTSAQPPAENLTASLKKLGTAFLGSKLVSGIVSMSDEMTQTTARLNLMNDGLQSTADLQELIYQSAMRSRGAYNATADAVAKMGLLAGDAFSSNQETIAFVEQLNKQFKIAGTSAEGQAAAMLQITQAMGSGVLRGEELNSVFEQAPTIIQSIADYLGVSVGEIRSMAQEGELTASVVKSALLSSAEETNRKFNEIPLTWSDVWTQASNMAVMSLQPLLEAINWVANNIEIIGPLVLAAAAAFALFAVAANWTKICAAATKALTAAQKMLNAVMSLNPIVLIIGSIIILIGVIAAYINYTNRAKNETTSAVGVICGLFAMAGAFVYNMFYLPVYNVIADLINFLGNVFQYPIASIEILFLQLSQYVVGVIRGMVRTIEKLINLIPGVKINITSGLDAFYDSYTDRIQKIKDQSGWTEYVKHKEKIEYSTAYANGYNWGANLQNSISEKLGLDLPDDPATGLLSNIADNTAQIADDVSVSSDDIKLLRDIAERQVINKYTTAEIKVEMVNHNNISNEMDLDGVVNLLEAKVTEALATSAEGVHI
nr:tape measure protein [uncultured Agathobaculum sp.]